MVITLIDSSVRLWLRLQTDPQRSKEKRFALLRELDFYPMYFVMQVELLSVISNG